MIRRLLPDDWPRYREIRLAALADSPDAFGSTLEVEEALPESEWRARLDRTVQFAAVVDGCVVGTIGVIPSDHDRVAAEFISMWVAPPHRGTGIGDALLRAALDAARAQGYDSVELWVAEGNTHAARLYERHAFVRTGDSQPVRDDDSSRLEFLMSRRQLAG